MPEGGNLDNSNHRGVRPPHPKEPTCLPFSADEKLPAWTVTMHLYSWDISVIVGTGLNEHLSNSNVS
jgi:hypothetical protein